MNGIKRIVIIGVLAGIFCGTFALAQTAKPKTGDFQTRATAATAEMLARLIRYYSARDDQKPKIKEVLIAQFKDLEDFDKVRGPKIKELDAEIAELKKKIEVIEKQKAVHAASRTELLGDHKAEITAIFSVDQRITRVSNYIKSVAVPYQYWPVLPKENQDSLKAKCDAAALELIQAKKENDTSAVAVAYRKIREDANKILTPEIRKNGDSDYYYGSTIRRFTKLKLTDSQKASVRDMCSKIAEKKIRIYAKYAQASKDRDALRRAVSGMSSSTLYYKIRQDVVDQILTDEQVKLSGYKRKTSSSTKKL
jgi:vacuolar-type H+-ATPase subunit I/STV1